MPEYFAMFCFIDKEVGSINYVVGMKSLPGLSDAWEAVGQQWTRMRDSKTPGCADGSKIEKHPLEIKMITLQRFEGCSFESSLR